MEYFAVILFAITSYATPGPNNTMIMTSGLNYGIQRSLPHYLGIILGFPTMVIAVGLGLATLFDQIPLFHVLLKITGAIYLTFLAWRIATAPVSELSAVDGKPFTFIQAAAFQWINPKGVVVIISAISAYTDTSTVILSEVLILVALFFLVTLGSVLLWAFSGALIASKLDTERKLMIFNRSAALLLLISVAPVLLDLL